MDRLSISRFWRIRDNHYRLVGKKCMRCGRAFYPPKRTCPHCGSINLENYEAPSKGRLISWTKLYDVGSEQEIYKPLYFGLMVFGELKVMLPLTDVTDEKSLKQDTEVELVFRRIKEDGEHGLIYYGIKARPAI